MAYVSQELKAKLAPTIKAILKKYGVKGSVAVRNNSTLVVNLKSGALDFIGNRNAVIANSHTQQQPHTDGYIQVNPYYTDRHYSGEVAAFFGELLAAMNVGNRDRSDVQSDYFDVGWYVDVNVGQWDKPYVVTS